MRGIAILLVVASHLVYFNPKIRRAGACGVGTTHRDGWQRGGAFFCVVGLPDFLAALKQKAAGSERVLPAGYAWRRFWKIYPPLALSVLLLAPVYIYRSADWTFLGIGARWLTGYAFLLPVSGEFNPVMWTLVIEVQFYTLLPLLFFCLKRLPAKTCLLVVPLFLLLVPFLMRLTTGRTPVS